MIEIFLAKGDVTYDLGLGTVEEVKYATDLERLRIEPQSYLEFFEALLPKNTVYVDETLESTAMWLCHWAAGTAQYLWINEALTEIFLMPIMVQQYGLNDQAQVNGTVALADRLYVGTISPISFGIFVAFAGVTLAWSGTALLLETLASTPTLKGFPDLEVAARMTSASFSEMNQRFLRAEAMEDIFGDQRIKVNEVIHIGASRAGGGGGLEMANTADAV